MNRKEWEDQYRQYPFPKRSEEGKVTIEYLRHKQLIDNLINHPYKTNDGRFVIPDFYNSSLGEIHKTPTQEYLEL